MSCSLHSRQLSLQVLDCFQKQLNAFAAGHFAHGSPIAPRGVGDNMCAALKGAGPGHVMLRLQGQNAISCACQTCHVLKRSLKL